MALLPQNQDCLNLVRIIAAIQVLYGHTCHHLNIDMPIYFSNVINFFLGVPIFFALSGYLIWNSISRFHNFRVYIMKRFWRIYPELWACVALSILSILLLFEGQIDWQKMLLFIFGQATIFQFWTPDFLRTFGCGVPNGSLWTICVIVQFYFIAWIIHKYLYGRSNVVWLLTLGGLMLISYSSYRIFPELLPILGYKIFSVTVIPYLWLFLLGCYCADKNEYVLPILKRYFIPILMLAIFFRYNEIDVRLFHYNLYSNVFLILGLIGGAYVFPYLNIKIDVSYGVYIYHMVIVNVFITLELVKDIKFLVGILFISFGLAIISQKLLGILSTKHKLKLEGAYNGKIL